uniref:Uncharacterized protein n=1 Tax=Florenciella parvula TaxID=236787 RepID=A0A7S2D128_9STRA
MAAAGTGPRDGPVPGGAPGGAEPPKRSGPIEPWDRFTRARATEDTMPAGFGHAPFFDLSSSADKGRFRVHDARGFAPESMRRAAHPAEAGMVLLLGTRPASHAEYPGAEQVITLMFDRAVFSEAAAEKWWNANREWAVGTAPLRGA